MVEMGLPGGADAAPVERLGAPPSSNWTATRTCACVCMGSLDVIESDVLKVDFTALAQTARLAGLPNCGCVWWATCPTTFHAHPVPSAGPRGHRRPALHAAKGSDRPHGGISPATGDYGRPSVMLQWRYAMENVPFVPPWRAVDPAPRVGQRRWCAWCPMPSLQRGVALSVPLLEELGAGRLQPAPHGVVSAATPGRWLEARQFGGEFDT